MASKSLPAQSAVGGKTFIDDDQFAKSHVKFFIIFYADHASNVHQSIFLGTEGETIGVTEHFSHDFWYALILVAFFTGLYEVGVFCKTRSVDENSYAITSAYF